MKKKKVEQTLSQNLWNLPNGLSMLRLFLTLPVVLLLRAPHVNRWGILALGLLAYLSDLADGYLARRFHQESDAGRIIDPLADKIFVAGVLLSLLAVGYIPLWYVVCVLGRDVLILLAGAWVSTRLHVVLPSNMTGKVAVASIGVVMIATMFADMLSSGALLLLMLLSIALLVSSLIKYTERLWTVIIKHRK